MTLNITAKPVLKLPLSSLASLPWNLENLKASTWKTKNLIALKRSIFTAQFIPECVGQKLFSKTYSEFLIDVIRFEFGKLFNWTLSYEFCKIFKDLLFTEHLWTTASEFFLSFDCLCQIFSGFEYFLSQLSNVMNIMNFAFGKLLLAKQMTQLFLHGNHLVILKNFAIFTGKHLCLIKFQVFRSAGLLERGSNTCFLVNIKNTYFKEHLQVASSEVRMNQKWNLRKQVFCKKGVLKYYQDSQENNFSPETLLKRVLRI